MLRTLGAGVIALGLHLGVGFGAHALAVREDPIVLKKFLLDKDLMKDILERIKELNEQDNYLEIALEIELEEVEEEELAELEELIEDMPEDFIEPETELATDYVEVVTAIKAMGEEGDMGDPQSELTGDRYGIKGPADNPDPHIARAAALRDAAEFGMIGLLNSGAGGDPDAPTAPWGRDDSLGNDVRSARGNMWGDKIGDSFGAGGLGLKGIGEGGGGRGEGIGLGSVGTIGHADDSGSGQGFGKGHGRLGRSHRARPPRVKAGTTKFTGTGELPNAVIARIVRQNFGRFRLCYEAGLKKNANLEGRVKVRFVIKEDGSVASDSVRGTGSMPDKTVVACVARAFEKMTFPAPVGGVVTVSYPIIFKPG